MTRIPDARATDFLGNILRYAPREAKRRVYLRVSLYAYNYNILIINIYTYYIKL